MPKLSVKDLLSLLEMLAELEGMCAKFAAKRMHDTKRKELWKAFEACEASAKAKRADEHKEANSRFYEIIYAGCKNDWAASQVRAIRLRCASYPRSRFVLPGRLERSLQEHGIIVEQIEAEDEEGARQSMINHLSIGGRDFAEFVSSVPSDFLSP